MYKAKTFVRLFYVMVILFIFLLIASTGEAYADLNLKYTVSIEKGSSTSHVQLYITNIDASYLDIEFKSEAQDQDIESYVSNLTAESDSYPLTITDTGNGKWRINSPGSIVTVNYDIKKIVYYDWDHLYASGNELAVYIDDEYGFLMAPFFFIYPVESTNIASIQIKFDVPDDWKVLTPYLEEGDHFTVKQTGNSLLSSFIMRQQIYMGKMKFYAEEWSGSCKVQMGVPEGDDNYWELQTLEEVENYVHATAIALTEYTRIFGDNPYLVYTMYPNFQEYFDEQWHLFPGTRYFGNGYQYWPEHRWSELTCHMSLSFMNMWCDPPLKVEFNIEKGIGEMYYGHTLAWLLFNDETYLAQMYYWYLVYDRMHGTWMTDALFAGNKEYPAYVKGEWVALLLDKKIQEVTNGTKSLDIVMNNLYSKYKQTDYEVTYQDLQNEVESITGSDFSAFFSQYVNGDEKIPVYQYVEPYKEYFLNLPDVLEETFQLRLYGKTFPLFILIEMTTNLQEHIMAGMYYQAHLDEFADYILSSYSIEQITESDVENALSQLTDKDCSGFFTRWENSFGALSLEELKEWLYAYQGNAPTVTTGSASSVTSSSATLNGTVNPNGLSTTYYFEYGTTTNYGSTTIETDAGSGTGEVSVSADLAGLSEGTTYHFRLIATNSGGTNYGDNATFTTTTTPHPPTVSSTNPANNTTDVAVNTAITATFSESMDSSTINTDTFLVSGSGNIAGTVIYTDTTATFTPETDLDYDTTYTATITTGAKDLAGNALEADHTWSFTTQSDSSNGGINGNGDGGGGGCFITTLF